MFAWGDNDHGQQGNAGTTVNRKPALVHGLEGVKVSRVACGSSHSICWTTQDNQTTNAHEPVLFSNSKVYLIKSDPPVKKGPNNNGTIKIIV